MLRITREPSDHAVTLRFEGKLLGPWVEEARRAVGREQRDTANQVVLDLEAVSFVDPAGAVLLRALVADGVRIARRSGFVGALLESEAL